MKDQISLEIQVQALLYLRVHIIFDRLPALSDEHSICKAGGREQHCVVLLREQVDEGCEEGVVI